MSGAAFEPASVKFGADAPSKKSTCSDAMGTTLKLDMSVSFFFSSAAPSGWQRRHRPRLLGRASIELYQVDRVAVPAVLRVLTYTYLTLWTASIASFLPLTTLHLVHLARARAGRVRG